MKRTRGKRSTRTLEHAVASSAGDEYLLRLYVAGTSPRSRQAIHRVGELCAGDLKGRYKLEVIDIYQEPVRARDAQIIATPTLVKESPQPMRQLIGTLTRPSLFLALGLAIPGTSVP